jgi:hypothetical protein
MALVFPNDAPQGADDLSYRGKQDVGAAGGALEAELIASALP